ncbi:hypothetical protein AB0323_11655 [Arthrobacter sp. NPDC080031]|uniref:hypothetical protein n=1 Tax=Arthrobacter sp. NPDC080031 TaxID=3155918 RepID=UPI00344F15AA
MLAPQFWRLWSLSGGIAQCGGFTVIFTAVTRVAPDQVTAGRMSTTVQGLGCCFAAMAPPLVGFIHNVSASWTPALLVILASVLTFSVSTSLSVRRLPQAR